MQQGLDVTLLAGLDLDAFEKFADPTIGTKVCVDKDASFFRRHAGVARQTEIAQAIKDSEVHDLGAGSLVRPHLLLGHGKNHSSRTDNYAYAAAARGSRHPRAGHIGQDTRLESPGRS